MASSSNSAAYVAVNQSDAIEAGVEHEPSSSAVLDGSVDERNSVGMIDSVSHDHIEVQHSQLPFEVQGSKGHDSSVQQPIDLEHQDSSNKRHYHGKHLEWKDVSYKVKDKMILQKCWGEVSKTIYVPLTIYVVTHYYGSFIGSSR